MKTIESGTRKKYIPIIKRNFLFKGVENFPEDKILNDIRAEWISFERDETIYDYDSYKNSLGMILKGRVSVKKDRNRRVLFNTLKAGEVFGGAVLFREGPFIAGITAQNKSDILFIPSDMMEELMEVSKEINMNYIRYLTDSLAFLNERLDIFSAGGAEERTWQYLMTRKKMTEEGIYMVDDMSMTCLAEYLLVGRATLYRILDSFEEKGIIRRDGRKIYLLKGESL